MVAARRERRRNLVELVPPSGPEPISQVDAPTSFAERDRVERELGRLPIEQRVVLVLHFYVGLPLTEAAMVLDIPVGTAKSRLHRGLEALRSTMTPESGVHNQRPQERPA
jgi:RNA polymerase sigma-70 factor (ECF subfamily)